MFNGPAITGPTLFVVGSTRSFSAGASDVAITSFALAVPEPMPEPASYTLLFAGLGLVGLFARRRADSASLRC